MSADPPLAVALSGGRDNPLLSRPPYYLNGFSVSALKPFLLFTFTVYAEGELLSVQSIAHIHKHLLDDHACGARCRGSVATENGKEEPWRDVGLRSA